MLITGGNFKVKNITIKELNKLLVQNFQNESAVTYPFADGYITQIGPVLMCSFNPSIYLAPGFNLIAESSYQYRMLKSITPEELSAFLRSLNPLTSLVTNQNVL